MREVCRQTGLEEATRLNVPKDRLNDLLGEVVLAQFSAFLALEAVQRLRECHQQEAEERLRGLRGSLSKSSAEESAIREPAGQGSRSRVRGAAADPCPASAGRRCPDAQVHRPARTVRAEPDNSAIAWMRCSADLQVLRCRHAQSNPLLAYRVL